jgi:hypothetical protein
VREVMTPILICPKAGTMDTKDRIPKAAIALKRIIPHMVKSDRQARALYNLGSYCTAEADAASLL